MKKLLNLVSAAFVVGFLMSSCSGKGDSGANNSSDSSAVNGSQVAAVNQTELSIDEIYAQIKTLVDKGDLEESEIEGAIDLYGKFYKAYTPIAVEMIKNGSKEVDVYVYQEKNYPYVTSLVNKRIYPVTLNCKNRDELEGRVRDNMTKLGEAIKSAQN